MIEYNIRTIEAEIEKTAYNKMTDIRQAEKLSSLYNARKCLSSLLDAKTKRYADNSKQEQIPYNTRATDELNDILPALKEYQQAKADFAQHKITQDGVNHYLHRLVVEINEFITVLHSNTTAPEERDILSDLRVCEQ